MKAHNIMEDVVTDTINLIFEEEEASKKRGFCTCRHCRLDVACLVLNKFPPQYIISGRGLAHIKSNYINRLQQSADIAALINKAIITVSNHKRPHLLHGNKPGRSNPEGILFNFPVITGRIFDGANFEPISGIEVVLLSEKKEVRMINGNWANPCPIVSNTPGSYHFWPYPQEADTAGEKRFFQFGISAQKKGYEPVQHYFGIEIMAKDGFADYLDLDTSYDIEDLYIFPPQ